jgi:hypothetical protein
MDNYNLRNRIILPPFSLIIITARVRTVTCKNWFESIDTVHAKQPRFLFEQKILLSVPFVCLELPCSSGIVSRINVTTVEGRIILSLLTVQRDGHWAEVTVSTT